LFIGDATNIFEDKKQISWRKWLWLTRVNGVYEEN
jgi:hypothetical protein